MAITVKTVSVTYGRKINLGDYNSATVDCTLWADVDEGDNLDQDMNDLWDMAKANVKAQALPLMKPNNGNNNMAKAFLGLPVRDQVEPYRPPVEHGAFTESEKLDRAAMADDVANGIDPRDGLPFGDK